MIVLRLVVAASCLICTLAGSDGQCSSGRCAPAWQGGYLPVATPSYGPQHSIGTPAAFVTVRAPIGATLAITPAAGRSTSYDCTLSDCGYAVGEGSRGPWCVEARDRQGRLLDYAIVEDLRRPVNLVNTLDARLRMQKPDVDDQGREWNFGLATDREGRPMWGHAGGDRRPSYGDPQVPDDRGKATITVIGNDALERQRLVRDLTTGALAPLAARYVVLDYPTQTWHVEHHRVAPTGKAVVIQPAQPGAAPLHRQEDFDTGILQAALQRLGGGSIEAVRQPDPSYRPELDPNLGRSGAAVFGPGILFAGLAALLFLLRRKEAL